MEDNHLSGMGVTSVPYENDALHIRYKCMEVVTEFSKLHKIIKTQCFLKQLCLLR